MKTATVRVAAEMRRREPASRSLSEQVTALCFERRILKKDIARVLKIDASWLAQKWVRGMTVEDIEKMTAAINRLDKSGQPPIQPSYFERYVWLVSSYAIDEDPDLVRIFRSFMFEWTDTQKEMWKRTSFAMIGRSGHGKKSPPRH